MEAKLFLHSRSNSLSSSMWVGRKLTHRHPQCLSSSLSPKVFAVLTTSPNITATSTSVHNDNWFNRIAINYLSQTVQVTTGLKNEKMGYQSLVEAAAMVSQNFNTKNQQELVMKALDKAFPQAIMSLIRTLLPQSKFTRELFALFTIFFFAWLVGPCEVKDSEVEGRMEKNVVHIKKCRFLEESSCVGMCLNLCKMPSQKFIKDSLGMPVNMVPRSYTTHYTHSGDTVQTCPVIMTTLLPYDNPMPMVEIPHRKTYFEDMSCDMIFGQEPMAASDDPAFKQPCYKTLCKSKQKHTSDCFS